MNNIKTNVQKLGTRGKQGDSLQSEKNLQIHEFQRTQCGDYFFIITMICVISIK